MLNSPLEQFKVVPLIRIYNDYIDLTISNVTIYLIIGVYIIYKVLRINNIDNNKIIKGRWGYIIERLYVEVERIIKDMIPTKYKGYIPLGIILFLFILINNIMGLIPYSYTTTAQIILTLTMSLSIMIGVTILGLTTHKLRFFNLFIPSGLDKGGLKFLIPLIFSIELISYLIRVISLSVRLAANLISGHTLLKIIANFGLKYTISLPILLILPIALLTTLFILETGVAVIQSYVFTLLTLTYISNIYEAH